MPNASYDTLTITINADSKQANTSINKLSKNLQNLEKVAKDLDTERIEQVKTLLVDIASIDFSNVSKGLQDVVNAFKVFQNKNFVKDTLGGTQLSNVFKKGNFTTDLATEDLGQSLQYGGFQVLEQQFLNLSNAIDLTNANFQVFKTSISTLPIDDTNEKFEAFKRAVGDVVKELGNFAKAKFVNIEKGLKKIALQFKNILKYRIIRKVIQEIYKALQEGLTQIASVDENFNASISNMINSLALVGNSLVSIIAPIIQMVEPFVSQLSESVAEIMTEMAQFFAMMNGQNQFAKATKGAKDYAKALEQTKSMGIDELNVIGNGKENNFVMEDVAEQTSEAHEFAEQLKTTFGVIKDLVFQIFNAVKNIVEKLLPPILTIVTLLLDLITTLVDSLLPPIIDFITLIVNTLAPVITAVVNLIRPFLDMVVDSVKLIGGAFKSIVGYTNEWNKHLGNLVTPMTRVLNVVSSILVVLKAVSDVLGAIITFRWGDVGDIISGARDRLASINDVSKQYSYASGGFPEDGFFFANHTELVGKFSNGQTAVANNQDIQQGIYEAVLSAMRESGGNQGVVVNLDGYKLAEIVTKRQNNMGQTLVYGGNLNYGK